MKTLWKLTKEAARYKGLYILAILSTLMLTVVNLTAPKVLSAMTGVVEQGVDDAALDTIMMLAGALLLLYLLRILFRFLSNYICCFRSKFCEAFLTVSNRQENSCRFVFMHRRDASSRWGLLR